jgi:mannose-1-phosphate guanylyltransferase
VTRATLDASETPALVLAAGLGTRLRPLTDRVPKCLVEIDGRPLLDYWFERLARAGVRRVRVNNHSHPEALRAYLRGAGPAWRLETEEAYEPVLLGSAGTVAANRDLADGVRDVLVVYGDTLSAVDLADLRRFHRSHSDPFTILLFRTPRPRACGIAEIDGEGRVLSFVEKPEQPASDLANAGVYVLDAEAYREIADLRAFDLAFDALPRFVGRMRGYVFEGYHRDIGTPESLEAARREAPAVFRAETTRAR